jgi:hypothetical protein
LTKDYEKGNLGKEKIAAKRFLRPNNKRRRFFNMRKRSEKSYDYLIG